MQAIDLSALVERLHAGVVVHDPTTRILYANPAALRLLRMSADQVLGRDALDPQWQLLDADGQVLAPSDYPVSRVLSTGSAVINQELGVCDSSSSAVTWVLCTAYPERTEDGELVQVVVTFTELAKRRHDIPFDAIVERASDVILVTEALPLLEEGPRIVYVNQAFTRLTGYSKSEVYGKTPRILQGPETDDAVRRRIRQALEQRQPIQAEILNYGKNGAAYWLDMNIVPLTNPQGEVRYFAAIERDVTHVKQHEARLTELATRDALTGLLNRRGFLELAQQQLAQAKRNGHTLCCAMLDIDHFKRINDQHGHAVGDDVIAHVAALLHAHFRSSDVLGRLGGEEFCVLLNQSTVDSARARLEEYRLLLEQSTVVTPRAAGVGLTISIGVAGWDPDAGIPLDALIQAADAALYRAKQGGRNRVAT